MLRAGTTGKLCTWEKACGTEQGRDKGCPMPFRLAKISQQRWTKQGICILLDRAQKCFNMRRCLTMLSLPAPHCRFVCHTGVDGLLIENNAVTCYANHADYYWQPRCRGGRFCSVAFFMPPIFVFNLYSDYIRRKSAKQESSTVIWRTKVVSSHGHFRLVVTRISLHLNGLR